MRRSTCLVAVAAFAAFAAQVPLAQADNSQQAKMTSCNADASAKQLTGEDRKAFMSKCLSKGSGSTAAGNSQQEKMKSCNAEANGKSLKGDERKTFMSSCLKAGSGNAVH